jgi:hypothetical protein
MSETFLTTKELARRWRCSERTLERRRTDGTGPRWFRSGKINIYPLTCVEEHERENLVRSTAEAQAAAE